MLAIDWNGKGAICAAATLLGALLLASAPARAQQQPVPDATASAADGQSAQPQPPDAEGSARALQGQPQPAEPKRDDRIFGVMPNHLTVETSENASPLTVGKKFKLEAEGVFDPYEFGIVGLLAGINQATDTDSSYGEGAAGYGKRYAAGFADQAIGNFMTGAIFPSILHDDPRYYRLGKGGFGHRAGYALSRLLVTRTDAGGRSFNYSELLGNAAGAGIGLAYRDQADRNISNVGVTFAEQIGVDALGNELKEFWPDIHRKVFHRRHPREEAGTAAAGVSATSASDSGLR